MEEIALRISAALEVIERYGMIHELHHKQWVLDQVVRSLLTPEGYEAWVAQMNVDPDYDPWDVGVAP